MSPTAATEAIWRTFQHRLLAYVGRRVSSPQDAEDIVQEVFARVVAHADQLADVQSPSGWIFQLTRHAIADHYRSETKADNVRARAGEHQEAGGDSLVLESGSSEDPQAELARCMEPLVDALPAPYEQALTLIDLGGASQKDAAAAVGLSLSGMKSRVQRGRSKLKDLLLDCCQVELDRRRAVVGYAPKNRDCHCAGPADEGAGPSPCQPSDGDGNAQP